jgi:hypothetical protein
MWKESSLGTPPESPRGQVWPGPFVVHDIFVRWQPLRFCRSSAPGGITVMAGMLYSRLMPRGGLAVSFA